MKQGTHTPPQARDGTGNRHWSLIHRRKPHAITELAPPTGAAIWRHGKGVSVRGTQPGLACVGGNVKLVGLGAQIASLRFLPRPVSLAGLDCVKQAVGRRGRRFTAKRATTLLLHAQLILPLPRNRQVAKLIFYRLSHIPFPLIETELPRGCCKHPRVTSSSFVVIFYHIRLLESSWVQTEPRRRFPPSASLALSAKTPSNCKQTPPPLPSTPVPSARVQSSSSPVPVSHCHRVTTEGGPKSRLPSAHLRLALRANREAGKIILAAVFHLNSCRI
jgi:hypothetical protein